MGVIAEKLPLLAQQEGVWTGEYVHVNTDHEIIDRHRSQLICRLFDGPEGEARFVQSNIYDWDDGTREVRYFEGQFRDDRVWIRNELIDGWTADIALDRTGRSLMVGWVRPTEPDFRFYELITMSEDGNRKNRTWHWYRKGRLFQRTLINERLASRDWEAVDDESFYHHQPRS